MSAPTANSLLLLFDRPNEPIFTPKGDEKKIIQVPEEYLVDRYKDLNNVYSLENRFATDASEKISVLPLPKPDLPLPHKLKKDARFSLFIPLHQQMANQVVEFLLGMQNLEDFWSAAVYFRANLNPQLFNYALSVAMLHYEETRNIALFSVHELFPEKFLDGDVLFRATEEVGLTRAGSDERITIDIGRDFSATDLDEEHRLAYFREDIGANLHHWHWHLAYPTSPKSIADKDRRGELFYYMNQQIIARYNMERLCNHLPRVKRLTNFQHPIKEAYFPKLTTRVSSQNWVGRGKNSVIQDVNRPEEELFFDVQHLERWRNRIFDAIDQGFVIDSKGEKIPLTEKDGIDILGNLVESSSLSINKAYYGSLHNMLHMAIATIHDPDFRHLEFLGVMGDSAIAMRDPVFYRVHAFLDDIFQSFKSTLPGYNAAELDFRKVRVEKLSIEAAEGEENELFTFWEKSAVNLSRGLDFTERGPIYANFTHLQYYAFTYNIEVENRRSETKGTVRIFIAPKYNETGEGMSFREQRKLFVELDRFTVNLSKGKQTIKRKSEESSVTIPFTTTYRNLDRGRPAFGEKLEKFNFCGCGWPDNLLIAKGTEAGFPCELFAMVTNFDDDKVEQELSSDDCMDGMSYCGVRNKKYPDARAMGFPFDRDVDEDVYSLEDFLRPNMKVTDVKIFHKGNLTI